MFNPFKKHASLKCCPLCGGQAEFMFSSDHLGKLTISVDCKKCGLSLAHPTDAEFHEQAYDDEGYLTPKAEKLMASRWNKRI